MLSWFEFTAFIWKAKGRHGTHSPFAYFLVDVVRKIELQQTFKENNTKKGHKIDKFTKQLAVALPEFDCIEIHESFAAIDAKRKQIIVVKQPINPDLYHPNVLPELHPESILILAGIFPRHHKKGWRALYANDFWHFSADAWYFGLLSPRPQQAKQHFLLKLT